MKTILLYALTPVLTILIMGRIHAQVLLEIGGDVTQKCALTMAELNRLPMQRYAATRQQGDTVFMMSFVWWMFWHWPVYLPGIS